MRKKRRKSRKESKLYKLLLKYFYSWYSLPLVILHEGCHIIVATILGFKINRVKIFKTKQLPLYSGVVTFAYRKYSWKWYAVLYAPLLLFIPFLLIFTHPVFIYISLYFLSNILSINNKMSWAILPSKGDLKTLKIVRQTDIDIRNEKLYEEYLINEIGEDKYYYHIRINRLRKLIKVEKLLTKDLFIKKLNKTSKK